MLELFQLQNHFPILALHESGDWLVYHSGSGDTLLFKGLAATIFGVFFSSREQSFTINSIVEIVKGDDFQLDDQEVLDVFCDFRRLNLLSIIDNI